MQFLLEYFQLQDMQFLVEGHQLAGLYFLIEWLSLSRHAVSSEVVSANLQFHCYILAYSYILTSGDMRHSCRDYISHN
jgi:hypothetical protein